MNNLLTLRRVIDTLVTVILKANLIKYFDYRDVAQFGSAPRLGRGVAGSNPVVPIFYW